METKKCSSCGKFMIKWVDNINQTSMAFTQVIEFKCACGNSEVYDIGCFPGTQNTFLQEWEKANGQ